VSRVVRRHRTEIVTVCLQWRKTREGAIAPDEPRATTRSSRAATRSPHADAMTSTYLITPAEAPIARLLLAHGAGGAMDSSFLEQITALLAARHIETWRFEFAYMAERRTGGKKRPAPKAETLLDAYRIAAGDAHKATPTLPLLIGGKSMGGRIASMVADELYVAGTAVGCVCLGYPFHPPNQPQTWRISHLTPMHAATLIVQGERDPFGTKAEVEDLVSRTQLSEQVRFAWIGDGDHDFGPRGGQGYTRKGNLSGAADAVTAFARTLTTG
jgi:uncharacterized protein